MLADMTVTDELLANAERYAAGFDKGSLPLPPAKHVAVVACMDARLNSYGLLDLDEDVRQSVKRITADPFIPVKDSVRGFVYDVADGTLREVK